MLILLGPAAPEVGARCVFEGIFKRLLGQILAFPNPALLKFKTIYCVLWQAIATETGKVMDDFTIKKAADYKPDITARNNFLYSGYQPDYKPTFLEVSPNVARHLQISS